MKMNEMIMKIMSNNNNDNDNDKAMKKMKK